LGVAPVVGAVGVVVAHVGLEFASEAGLFGDEVPVSGAQIDQAVTAASLASLEPAGVHAALAATEALQADHDTALAQWRRQVESAGYEATRAERSYLAVDPDNRLVARGLEADWVA
jgi:hypothetical protein